MKNTLLIAASLTLLSSLWSADTAVKGFSEEVTTLAWDKSIKELAFTLENPGATALTVMGVQSTSGLWVVQFPAVVGAKSTGRIDAILEAKLGHQSAFELLRVKTSAGERVFSVRVDRPPLLTFDATVLRWAKNETVPKQVLVRCNDRGVTVQAVSAAYGHGAVLERVSPDLYRVTVTPSLTSKRKTFPVSLTLDPAIPGLAPLITGIVDNR